MYTDATCYPQALSTWDGWLIPVLLVVSENSQHIQSTLIERVCEMVIVATLPSQGPIWLNSIYQVAC